MQMQHIRSSCAPTVRCPSLQRLSSSDTLTASISSLKVTAQHLPRQLNPIIQLPRLTRVTLQHPCWCYLWTLQSPIRVVIAGRFSSSYLTSGGTSSVSTQTKGRTAARSAGGVSARRPV